MLNKNFKRIVLVLGLIGLIDAIYLTILKLTNNEAMCIKGVGDCLSVNSSVYSQILGVPIALIGSLGYLAFILVVLFESRNEFFGTYSIYFMFGITLIGVLYSGYLTYLEIAVIRAICPFCVISAIIMLILFILTVTRLANPQVETT